MDSSPETLEALRKELSDCRRELYLCGVRYGEAVEQIENLQRLVEALSQEIHLLRGG